MGTRRFKFIAEAVNKESGQPPMTFILEEEGGEAEGSPYTTGFDLGDTDFGKGLKVFSRSTDTTDGTDEAKEAAFGAHLALFVRLNEKHAETLGNLRDRAKSGDLWRTAAPAPQQRYEAPPPPMTSTPQTNPPGPRRRPAPEAEAEVPPAAAAAAKPRRPAAL